MQTFAATIVATDDFDRLLDVVEAAAAVAVHHVDVAAVDDADAVDACKAHAVVPAAGRAELLDVLEELADSRVVAVADASHERSDRPAPARLANREPWERGRQAVAVAFRAHVRLANCRRAPAPGRCRVALLCENGDLVRLDTSATQGQVRDEPDESAADDRDAAVHLTEPASSPSTK